MSLQGNLHPSRTNPFQDADFNKLIVTAVLYQSRTCSLSGTAIPRPLKLKSVCPKKARSCSGTGRQRERLIQVAHTYAMEATNVDFCKCRVNEKLRLMLMVIGEPCLWLCCAPPTALKVDEGACNWL
jgi:hypothetical protein